MRQLAYSAFVAFWSSVVTLLAVDMLAPERAVEAQDVLPVYTLDELAGHDTLESCWMAVEGQVYDITDYVPMHPTPPDVLLPWCGREATEGMRTKGYGRDHSPAAWAMLEDYLVGTVGE